MVRRDGLTGGAHWSTRDEHIFLLVFLGRITVMSEYGRFIDFRGLGVAETALALLLAQRYYTWLLYVVLYSTTLMKAHR